MQVYYERVYRFFLGSWLLMMLNFSGAFSLPKQVLLLILLALSTFELLVGLKKLSLNVCFFLVLWLFLCSLSYLHGLKNGYVESYSLLNYVFLTPVVCYLIASTITRERLFFVNKILIISLSVAILISFLYASHIFGLIRIPDTVLQMGFFGGVKMSSDMLEMRMSNQSGLIFLVPYISTLLVFYKGKARAWLCMLLFLSLLITIISGRRALQIIFLFGLVVAYFVYVYHSKNITHIIVNTIVIAVISLFAIYGVFQVISIVSEIENPINAFINTLLMGFDSSQKSTTVRAEQVVALLDFWDKSPVIGHGLNSHPTYLRSTTDKWSYEFVYLAFFSQNGIILGLLFMSSFLIIWLKMWSKFKLDNELSIYFISILNGSLCYFIAAGTNPMIQFYWFWVLFLIPLSTSFNSSRCII